MILDDYINLILTVASNQTLNLQIRQQILQFNSNLYYNETVIREWEIMLLLIQKSPRPVPFLYDGLLFPWKAENKDQNMSLLIHSDIINDIQKINENDNSLLNNFSLKDFLSLSIPYNIEPIRVSDELKLLL